MYAFDGTNLLEYNTKKFNDLSKTYLPLSGGAINGNLLLHADSGDSPKLIFERGDNTGTITDWNMYVSSGILKINTVATSASTAEKTVVSINYNGDFDVTGRILENGTALSSKYGVLAGTNSWTGSNTFSGGTILNGSVSCNSNTNVRDGDYFKIADADAPANTFRFDVGANKLKKLNGSTTTYEWTFPSKTGTLATTDDIPSVDLSGYGALASANTWSGSNTFKYGLDSNSYITAINTVYGQTVQMNGRWIDFKKGNIYTRLQMTTDIAENITLNLPAKSGTLATLDDILTSNNTWSGINTFSSFKALNGSYGFHLDALGLYSTPLTVTTFTDGAPNSMIGTKYGHGSIIYDPESLGDTYTLTMPKKSGTLATTDDIPSVDLSGYGALASVNNWTATNTFSSGIMVKSPNNTNYLAFSGNQVLVNGSGNLTFPTKSGTIATLDDIPDSSGAKLYLHSLVISYNSGEYAIYLNVYKSTNTPLTAITNLNTFIAPHTRYPIYGYNKTKTKNLQALSLGGYNDTAIVLYSLEDGVNEVTAMIYLTDSNLKLSQNIVYEM